MERARGRSQWWWDALPISSPTPKPVPEEYNLGAPRHLNLQTPSLAPSELTEGTERLRTVFRTSIPP